MNKAIFASVAGGLCRGVREWLRPPAGACARGSGENSCGRMAGFARRARERAAGRLPTRRTSPSWQHGCHGLSRLDVLMEMVRRVVPQSKAGGRPPPRRSFESISRRPKVDLFRPRICSGPCVHAARPCAVDSDSVGPARGQRIVPAVAPCRPCRSVGQNDRRDLESGNCRGMDRRR